MQQMDDSAMLLALKEGEIKAYQYFFMKYYKPLCLKARMMLKNMDDAEKLVRDVFVKVWEEKLYLEIEHSVGGYFYRLVHNNCVHILKKRSNNRLSNDPGFLLMQQVVLPLQGFLMLRRIPEMLNDSTTISLALPPDEPFRPDFFSLLQSIQVFKSRCKIALKSLMRRLIR
jgi:DNA-directed RNA polymerase specialized sigma24 family protein